MYLCLPRVGPNLGQIWPLARPWPGRVSAPAPALAQACPGSLPRLWPRHVSPGSALAKARLRAPGSGPGPLCLHYCRRSPNRNPTCALLKPLGMSPRLPRLSRLCPSPGRPGLSCRVPVAWAGARRPGPPASILPPRFSLAAPGAPPGSPGLFPGCAPGVSSSGSLGWSPGPPRASLSQSLHVLAPGLSSLVRLGAGCPPQGGPVEGIA